MRRARAWVGRPDIGIGPGEFWLHLVVFRLPWYWFGPGEFWDFTQGVDISAVSI
jgi:hypothetical protein